MILYDQEISRCINLYFLTTDKNINSNFRGTLVGDTMYFTNIEPYGLVC